MAVTAAPPPEVAAEWKSKRGRAPGLEGLEGRLRLVIGDTPVGTLRVQGDSAEIAPDAEAATSLIADEPRTLVQILGGELHPIVARLQGRARVEGDIGFALRILLGLQAGSPWTGLAPRS